MAFQAMRRSGAISSIFYAFAEGLDRRGNALEGGSPIDTKDGGENRLSG